MRARRGDNVWVPVVSDLTRRRDVGVAVGTLPQVDLPLLLLSTLLDYTSKRSHPPSCSDPCPAAYFPHGRDQTRATVCTPGETR